MSKHTAGKTASKAVAGFTVKKLGVSVALVGSAAGVAGMGTFGAFTSTTSASRSDTAGTVVIALGSASRLSTSATGLVPGDTIQRLVQVNNTGNQAFGSVAMTTAATSSSLLDTDSSNGLQLKMDLCSNGWVEAGSNPAYTYSCTGTVSSVIASRPVIGAAIAMNNLNLAAGASNSVLLTLSFPTAAGNTFQAQSSTIGYTFNATQRTATNQ